MGLISSTDLILHKDGSVYHLNLLPKNISDTIIAVGDPNRVYQVSKHFDSVDFEMNQREFITHTGTFKGKRLTVISTGIGTDNIEIFLTELDALVNIDLAKRQEKPTRRKLRIVRVGTSGAMQEDIPVGTHLVSENAVGLDNLMEFYHLDQSDIEKATGKDLQEKTGLALTPYVVSSSPMLVERIGFDMVKGNTITAPGFYAPQGRQVRLPLRYPKLLEQLTYFHRDGFWLTNFEMETAAYYAFGRLLGHEMLSVNAIIVNRIRNEYIKNAAATMDSLILKVLERI